MKNIKFVVKVNRGGAHAPQYVLRVDRLPIQTTTDRKLALVMGDRGRSSRWRKSSPHALKCEYIPTTYGTSKLVPFPKHTRLRPFSIDWSRRFSV